MTHATGHETDRRTHLLEGARLLGYHGGVVEVRLLETSKGRVSGYFDTLETLVTAVLPWDGQASVYVTANPVHPDLLARATNRLKPYAKVTTKDTEIVRRAWFLTDFDPKRPKGIASTAAELAAALARRDDVVDFLQGLLGFHAPVTAMSGNGGHALWPCDLPNDDATTALVEQAVKVLHARFSDNVVEIDRAIVNAARIWKLYGSVVVTGDPTPDRPHRRATFDRPPEELVPLERGRLEQLAAMAAPTSRPHTSAPPPGGWRPFDFVAAFEARGLYGRALHEGRHTVTCPWAEAHSGASGATETLLFDPPAPGQPWGFDCKHSHCTDRTIKDVYAFLHGASNGHHPPQRDAPPTSEPSAPPPADPESDPIDDLAEDALARLFTRQHREDLRYVHEWGQWLRWDTMRWAVERTLAVYDLSRKLVRALAPTIVSLSKRDKVQSAATVNAIVSLARVDRGHARVTADFDRDPWLLNTPAGTVDLRTGDLRAHDRAEGLTKVTPIAPLHAGATSTLWQACLRTWTKGDAELEAFLQRFAGYCVTGSVREERLPIIYGPGGNGKTKFIEALRGCLGPDYVTNVAMETLIVTKGEQHPTDLADLRGKRLAIAVETEEGRWLAEAKVKSLTGGERIRARYMRRDFFEFDPTHKLVIVGNHRPSLRNVDEAIRRRILLNPFDATIPPSEVDAKLADKLAAERPAILRWMIDGCLAWQKPAGLAPPTCVLAATEAYFESVDALGRWLEECCVLGSTERVAKGLAFASWKAWAEKAGEYVGTVRRLNDRLAHLPGVDEARLGKARDRSWIGLGLQPPEPPAPPKP